jgi:hypothetical protein
MRATDSSGPYTDPMRRFDGHKLNRLSEPLVKDVVKDK